MDPLVVCILITGWDDAVEPCGAVSRPNGCRIVEYRLRGWWDTIGQCSNSNGHSKKKKNLGHLGLADAAK